MAVRVLSVSVVLASLATLTACSQTALKDVAPPETPARFSEARPASRAMTPDTAWWTVFGDPVLNGLVAEALNQNIGLEMARERIEQAKLSARINGADLLPAVTASAAARASGTKTGDKVTATTTRSAALSAAWLFNPQAARAQKRADQARIAESEEALNQARLDLIADLTDAWLSARAAGRRLAIARQTLAVQQKTADITEVKIAAGTANALDGARARAALASTSADIPALEQDRAVALHQVAILIGRTPGDLGRMPVKPLYRPSTGAIAAGVPADLIRNRPDIRAAEQVLIASTAGIGLSEAALWPSLTLSGNLGVSAAPKITSWSFGPSVTLPLFNRAGLYAAVDLSKSAARVDYLAWKESIIAAVGEVETALVAYRQEGVRRGRLSRAVAEYRTAATLARTLYEAGNSAFDTVLDAESALYRAEQELAASDAALAADIVALARALGGGWSPSAR